MSPNVRLRSIDINPFFLATALIALCLMNAVTMLIGISAVRDLNTQIESQSWVIDHYSYMYQRKNGYSAGFGNYDLLSLDQGKTWYQTTENRDGTVSIVPADPDLISHINGMGALMKYVEINGPIKLGDPVGLKILHGAGFDVVSVPVKEKK